jgi:hypothetical protein
MTELATDGSNKESCAVKDVIRAQSGWRVTTEQVDMFVTKTGAHMAPVSFCRDIELSSDKPTTLNYIQGVVQIPAEFDIVEDVAFRPGKAVFRSVTGVEVVADVNHEFLESGRVFPASGS